MTTMTRVEPPEAPVAGRADQEELASSWSTLNYKTACFQTLPSVFVKCCLLPKEGCHQPQQQEEKRKGEKNSAGGGVAQSGWCWGMGCSSVSTNVTLTWSADHCSTTISFLPVSEKL